MGLAVVADDLARRPGADQVHAVAELMAVDEPLELGAHRALAHDDAVERHAARAQQPARLQEVREALARIQAAAGDDPERLRRRRLRPPRSGAKRSTVIPW